MLLPALNKNLMEQANTTASGGWKRMTGHEIMGQTLGIIGLGRIGREVVIRANVFGMKCIGFDLHCPEEFAKEHKVTRMDGMNQLLSESDIVSLHTNLTEETRDMIYAATINRMKDGVILINCGRGELTHTVDIVAALDRGKLDGYGTDVLDQEPSPADRPLLGAENCIVIPHVGLRTYENVRWQAGMATQNPVNLLKGEKALAQVNDVKPPADFFLRQPKSKPSTKSRMSVILPDGIFINSILKHKKHSSN